MWMHYVLENRLYQFDAVCGRLFHGCFFCVSVQLNCHQMHTVTSSAFSTACCYSPNNPINGKCYGDTGATIERLLFAKINRTSKMIATITPIGLPYSIGIFKPMPAVII